MPTKWLDFTAIKREVPIREVLARYGYLAGLTEKKQDTLVGPCPIHGGKNATSFHVNTTKNIWNCFSNCGGGNVLDLVMKVEGIEIRAAGEKLASWFNLVFEREPRGKTVKKSSQPEGVASAAQPKPAASPEVNPPLERSLLSRVQASLNQDHAYLFERGLTVATIKDFGIGVASRGFLRGCCGIPIAREDGEIIAFAGRIIDPELAKEGKYKLPSGFQKSHVVFNLNRAKEHADVGLIVVEGFFDAMKVHQAGYPNVVALMGSTLSEQQEELLVAYADRLALMFDGDDAGSKCLREFYGKLRQKLYLKEIRLERGEQPDSLSEERIRELLGAEP
jgi:DNA primase